MDRQVRNPATNSRKLRLHCSQCEHTYLKGFGLQDSGYLKLHERSGSSSQPITSSEVHPLSYMRRGPTWSCSWSWEHCSCVRASRPAEAAAQVAACSPVSARMAAPSILLRRTSSSATAMPWPRTLRPCAQRMRHGAVLPRCQDAPKTDYTAPPTSLHSSWYSTLQKVKLPVTE